MFESSQKHFQPAYLSDFAVIPLKSLVALQSNVPVFKTLLLLV